MSTRSVSPIAVGSVGVFLLVACAGSNADRPGAREGGSVTAQSIEAAQEQLTDSVLALPGVVGTAIGLCEGKPCIKVYVARKTAELSHQIPSTYGGFPVDIEETGEFQARPDTGG